MQVTPRDKRALIIAVALAVTIVGYIYLIEPTVENWSDIRAEQRLLAARLQRLQGASPAAQAKRRRLLEAAPVIELPENEETQRLAFKRSAVEQAKKAGLKLESCSFIAARKSKDAPGKILQLQCRAGGKFENVLKFFAEANRNGRLCAIEEMTFTLDENKREQIKLSLTLSTLAQ